MGREIVYCGSCGKRLSGSDIERGAAVRTSGNYFCRECAPSDANVQVSPKAPPSRKPHTATRRKTARLPAPEREPHGSSTTRTTRAAPRSKKRVALIAGASLSVVVLVVLAILLFTGGEQKPPVDSGAKPGPVAKVPPAPPKPPAPPPKPPIPEKPPPEPPPDPEKKTEEALNELKRRSQEACGEEEFGKAVALWEAARPRFESDAWKETVEEEIRVVRQAAMEQWKSLKESTPEDVRDALRERIKPWGMPEIARELEELLKPKEPSAALKAYREAWGRAMTFAAGGDWGAAMEELGEPEDAEAKAEAEADRALFEKMKALPAVPKVERGREVSVEYARTPSEYAKLKGAVVRADDQRMELDLGEKKRAFVEWRDLSPASRARLLKDTGAGARALAALCLVGKDPEAAEELASRDDVPAKYWAWASEGKAAPPARDRGEYDARDLFHLAELEWRNPEKTGEAIEKYKAILKDYVWTPIALKNATLLTKRSEAGKDYVLFPVQLNGSGAFRRLKHEKVPVAWTLPRDVQEHEEQKTYVEASYYALEGTSYKGWAYLGGCCAEVFTAYYQTTEGKARDPRTRKEYVLEPGGPAAMPLRHRIMMLPSKHASHKGQNKPKRWEWVPLEIPENYSAPGRKVFRFLATRKDFSVALVIFSSVRKRPPNKDETAALYAPELASAPEALAPSAPNPALSEIWKLLVENKAALAGKTAPVKLDPPFDKADAVVNDVTEKMMELTAKFAGGEVGVTKQSGEFMVEELKGLLKLAGVKISPDLEKQLADLGDVKKQTRVEATIARALETAKARMAREDWKGAIEILQDVLRQKPGDPAAKKLLAEAQDRFAPILTLDLGGGVTMEFVYIKPGTFMMGGESTSEGRFQAVELPKHQVTLTKGFYLGKYEVTQAQYQAVMGSNPSKSTRDPNCPADQVAWDKANAFCKKVAEKTGRKVRLPTEAEWEYACRAGTDTDWSFGSDPSKIGEYAWFAGNSGGASHPVGEKKPNRWGLYDMHGNVCERVADLYQRDYYASSPKQDPTGADVRVSFGGNGTTIMRGGTWKCEPPECKSGARLRGGGYGVYHNWGFRAAVTPRDDEG